MPSGCRMRPRPPPPWCCAAGDAQHLSPSTRLPQQDETPRRGGPRGVLGGSRGGVRARRPLLLPRPRRVLLLAAGAAGLARGSEGEARGAFLTYLTAPPSQWDAAPVTPRLYDPGGLAQARDAPFETSLLRPCPGDASVRGRGSAARSLPPSPLPIWSQDGPGAMLVVHKDLEAMGWPG